MLHRTRDLDRYVAANGAYAVSTMSVIFATMEVSVRIGTPPESMEKFWVAREHALTIPIQQSAT